MYYGLLAISTFLFAAQFLFNQQYQRISGTSWTSTCTFALLVNGVGMCIQLVLCRFQLEFSWYSLSIASIQAIASFVSTYASLKALGMVNLAVYSMFSMLGGMALPFAYGVIFRGEPMTWMKAGCGLLITAALVLTIKGEKNIWRNTRYYWAVFVLNGMAGVLSTIHQSNEALRVSSSSYMVMSNLVGMAIAAGLLLAMNKGLPKLQWKQVGYASGYAAFTGIGNLLVLIALTVLPASVQYPIITGGVICCSTLVAVLRREPVSRMTWYSTGLALVASVLIAL